MADRQVSITVEGKTRFTSEGAEEVRRKAAEIGQAAKGAIGDASNLDLGMQRAGKSASQAFHDAARSLADLNPGKALRESLEAVKAGNLEHARSLQHQVARYGAANPQGGHLEAAASLSSVLRAAETNKEVGGGATAERLRRFVQGYEGRFADLLAPLEEPGATGINSNVYANRARRMIHCSHAAIPGSFRPGEVHGLECRLQSAQRYLERARNEGANTDALKELTDELEKTKGALGEHKGALERAGRVTRMRGQRPRGQRGGRLTGAGQMLERDMGRFAGELGPLTRVLSFLPEALPFMATAGVFWAAPAVLGAANQKAREQVVTFADLSRQFGYSGDAMKEFREPTGQTIKRLRDLGFSASEAGSVLSTYGQPLPNGQLPVGPLQSILTTARTTGLTPEKMAQTAAQLRREGATTPASMDTLKSAMAAGMKEGISQSDTLTALSGVTQQIYQNGKALTDAGLRQYAVVQQNLAATGQPYFQRQAGATAMEHIISGLGNPQDPGIKAILATHLPDFTAKQLGLVGPEAAFYNKIQAESPVRARMWALSTIAQNPTGPVVQSASKAIDQTFTDPVFKEKAFEKVFGLSGPQALSTAARGGLEAVLKPGKLPPAPADVQAANTTARQSRQILVEKADLGVIESVGTLKLTGNFEADLQTAKIDAAGAVSLFFQGKPGAALEKLGAAGMETAHAVGLHPEAGQTPATKEQLQNRVTPPLEPIKVAGIPTPLKREYNPPGAMHANALPGHGWTLPAFLMALGAQESNNNPNVDPNKATGALGRFQVLPGNLKRWSKKYLGRVVTPEEFQNSPELQKRLAYLHNLDLYQQLLKNAKEKWHITLTPEQIETRLAAAHYGGDSLINLPPKAFQKALDVKPPEGVPGPSIREYAEQVGQRVPPYREKGYAAGGYTGDRSPAEVAGVVHGSEFVVNAEATRRNRALLERINAGSNQQSDTRRVEVVFSGSLPSIRVEGMPGAARQQAEALSRAYMEQLARLVTAPQSYRGD